MTAAWSQRRGHAQVIASARSLREPGCEFAAWLANLDVAALDRHQEGRGVRRPEEQARRRSRREAEEECGAIGGRVHALAVVLDCEPGRGADLCGIRVLRDRAADERDVADDVQAVDVDVDRVSELPSLNWIVALRAAVALLDGVEAERPLGAASPTRMFPPPVAEWTTLSAWARIGAAASSAMVLRSVIAVFIVPPSEPGRCLSRLATRRGPRLPV